MYLVPGYNDHLFCLEPTCAKVRPRHLRPPLKKLFLSTEMYIFSSFLCIDYTASSIFFWIDTKYHDMSMMGILVNLNGLSIENVDCLQCCLWHGSHVLLICQAQYIGSAASPTTISGVRNIRDNQSIIFSLSRDDEIKMKVIIALFHSDDNREEGNKGTILSSVSPNTMPQKTILATTTQMHQRRRGRQRKRITKASPNGSSNQ